MITPLDFVVIAPELILLGGAVLLLMCDAFWPAFMRTLGVMAAAVVIFAALLVAQQSDPDLPLAFGALSNDAFSMYIAFVVLVSAFLVVLLSWSYLEDRNLAVGEYVAGILIASAAMILIAVMNHSF